MIWAVSDMGSSDLGSKRFLKNFISRKNNSSNELNAEKMPFCRTPFADMWIISYPFT